MPCHSYSPRPPMYGSMGRVGTKDTRLTRTGCADEFAFRCVSCLERERWYPNGHAGFGVDHVRPKGQAEYEHLICYYPNLVYACNRCNSAKQDRLLVDR